MNFLNKVESVYLNILRLVVITVATLALVLSVSIGISSAFKLLGAEPNGGTIKSPKFDKFISLKVPSDNSWREVDTSIETDTAKEVKPNNIYADLDATVKNNSKYLKEVLGAELNEYQERSEFVTYAKYLPEKYRMAYFKSANEFSAQLLGKIEEQKAIVASSRASGNASPNGFIDISYAWKWHNDNFSASVRKNEAEVAEHALSKASGVQDLYIAAGSFVAFLLIVFLFLIIKIERNLRGASVSREINSAL